MRAVFNSELLDCDHESVLRALMEMGKTLTDKERETVIVTAGDAVERAVDQIVKRRLKNIDCSIDPTLVGAPIVVQASICVAATATPTVQRHLMPDMDFAREPETTSQLNRSHHGQPQRP